MLDVARLAGVSVSTVSHVVNGTREVRRETRDQVLAAIESTGYTHNTIARALARASTGSLGLVVSVSSNPHFPELVQAVGAEATRQGYTLLLGDSGDDAAQEGEVVRALAERRVDGMLLVMAADPELASLGYLRRHGLPLVLLDRLADAPVDQVGVENADAMAALVDHVAAHGHTRIALLAGQQGLSTSQERIAGYRHGLERNGLPFDPELVATGYTLPEPGHSAMQAVLRVPDPPTAVVAGNNVMTVGALRALRERGLAVPGDVALVCFDEAEWADLFTPPLTSIAQPVSRCASEAVRLLLRRLGDPEAPAQTIRLAPTFHRRQSCGCGSDLDPVPQA